MGRADVYPQPDAPDPVLSDATVLTLARRHVPRATAVSGIDESGGEARVYQIDGDLILKTQRPYRLRPRTSLAKEAYLLDRLASSALAGRVPQLYGYGRAETAHGPVEYLCLSRIPGRPLVQVPTLATRQRHAVLREVGAMLAILHATDTAPADNPLLPTDADATALATRLRLGLADLVDAIAERPGCWRLPIAPARVADQAVALLPAPLHQPPTLLHSNPGPTHVFVDPDRGAVTGLIDFGDSYRSHPALDFRSWPAPADRQLLRAAYLAGRQPDAQFDRVWTVVMIYADLAAIAGGSAAAVAAGTDLLERFADR